MWEDKNIGISSRACSIFPATLQNPLFENPRRIEYILADGRFHDDRNYYDVLTSDACVKRPFVRDDILKSHSIPQSSLGVHTHLTLTARGVREELFIRTVVQMSTKSVSLDFCKQHLAYMAVNTATPCGHDRSPLELAILSPRIIRTTSLSAPALNEADASVIRGSPQTIAMALTHKNAEAQFLACVLTVPTLFQGDSCLECAVKEAYELEMELVIQS